MYARMYVCMYVMCCQQHSTCHELLAMFDICILLEMLVCTHVVKTFQQNQTFRKSNIDFVKVGQQYSMCHELLTMFDVCIFVCMHIVKAFPVIGCQQNLTCHELLAKSNMYVVNIFQQNQSCIQGKECMCTARHVRHVMHTKNKQIDANACFGVRVLCLSEIECV